MTERENHVQHPRIDMRDYSPWRQPGDAYAA